jgi:uncharacterized membrane protein
MAKPTTHILSDQQVEIIIGNLLRIAVLISALFVFIGGILYLIHYAGTHPDDRVFTGEPLDLRTLPGILRDAIALHSRGIIQLGIILLIATPVARVIFAIFAFLLQCDRIYVVVSLIVLTVLIYSLMSSR